ncbi:hypothetical protein FDI23_gp097 [Serratia phage CHI14]|uniref:Uncharacterized protein n=2 Tax=Winklervirus chi14 TaxID=2560752 RepID=A0A1Z1LYB0_9CAUD|nr:hypothetical protein FDI23_gp097 [Serratia phage CHI14]ARW57520.1 hypothetical protein [Serratia phage CHI14]ARW57795.1 hypothetical protein [Serratia phage CBH8]
MKTWVSYGRPHPRTGRRWYLEAVCRETGFRVNGKFACKPTKKQLRKFKRWARHQIEFKLYWDAI